MCIYYKKGFKNIMEFTTKYGSIDNTFIPLGKRIYNGTRWHCSFLEHKMFESEKEMFSNNFLNMPLTPMLILL